MTAVMESAERPSWRAATSPLATPPTCCPWTRSCRCSEGRTINLGEVSGVVYYTVEREGLRVVATLAQGDSGKPVRIEAILAPGQSVILSTPRGLGMAPDTVEIGRHDGQILVQAAPVTN